MEQEVSRIRKREDLPPLERAVSDTLDEYLFRLHGVMTSWADPYCFMEWLKGRGYKIVKIDQIKRETNNGYKMGDC